MLKSIEKENNNKYNYVIQNVNNFEICEPGNPYGHVRKFMRLKKEKKYEAHRVISPVALKLSGIEEVYSARDINGNRYDFEIFSDSTYRVIDVAIYKEIIEEVLDERYS